jgi:hypothetical protein
MHFHHYLRRRIAAARRLSGIVEQRIDEITPNLRRRYYTLNPVAARLSCRAFNCGKTN